MSAAVDDRHEWVANEEITHDLLNAMGGKCVYYETATDDNLFGTAEQNLLSVAVTASSPRLFGLFAAGTVRILDDTGISQLYFTAAAPNNPTPGHIATLNTWRGYTDAGGTARLAGSIDSFCPYYAVLQGTHTLHVAGVNTGSGGTNCQIDAGFRFMVCDFGNGFG